MLKGEGVIADLLAGYADSDFGSLRRSPARRSRVRHWPQAARRAPCIPRVLLVVEDVPWPVTDLRVDYADDPVDDLVELWRVWKPQKDDYRVRGIDPTRAPSYGVPGDQ